MSHTTGVQKVSPVCSPTRSWRFEQLQRDRSPSEPPFCLCGTPCTKRPRSRSPIPESGLSKRARLSLDAPARATTTSAQVLHPELSPGSTEFTEGVPPGSIQCPKISLTAVVRRPSSGRYYHWSLAAHDEDEGEWYIFEAVRSHPRAPFHAHLLMADPRPTAFHIVPVCTLPREDLDGVRGAIRNVVINASDINYDNQD